MIILLVNDQSDCADMNGGGGGGGGGRLSLCPKLPKVS